MIIYPKCTELLVREIKIIFGVYYNTGKTALRVYVTNAKAVLMSDTPTELNDESLIPNPGESKDPCDKKILFTIQKIWQDEYNKDESRPDSIKVRLWQHWLNQDGTPVIDGSEEKVVLFTDNAVVSDIDTTDGWFSMTKTDHERADSATWTRVVDGLPVYTADNSTYYSYTVEEAPIVGYTVESNSVDEIGSTATIVNRAKTFEIKFKYYDRYQIDGRPAGIDDKETVYTVSLTGIPIQYVKNVEGVESVDGGKVNLNITMFVKNKSKAAARFSREKVLDGARFGREKSLASPKSGRRSPSQERDLGLRGKSSSRERDSRPRRDAKTGALIVEI